MIRKLSFTIIGFMFATFALTSTAIAVDAPDMLTIDTNGKGKKVARFNHRGHVIRMGNEAACKTCHHKREAGESVKKCAACHKTRTENDTPSFKAAYHKTCKDCHKRHVSKQKKPKQQKAGKLQKLKKLKNLKLKKKRIDKCKACHGQA